jgi:predicted aspartyl protease
MMNVTGEATVNKVQNGQPKMTVKINNSNVDFLIDTVSSINILDENKFKKIGSKPNFLTPINLPRVDLHTFAK